MQNPVEQIIEENTRYTVRAYGDRIPGYGVLCGHTDTKEKAEEAIRRMRFVLGCLDADRTIYHWQHETIGIHAEIRLIGRTDWITAGNHHFGGPVASTKFIHVPINELDKAIIKILPKEMVRHVSEDSAEIADNILSRFRIMFVDAASNSPVKCLNRLPVKIGWCAKCGVWKTEYNTSLLQKDTSVCNSCYGKGEYK